MWIEWPTNSCPKELMCWSSSSYNSLSHVSVLATMEHGKTSSHARHISSMSFGWEKVIPIHTESHVKPTKIIFVQICWLLRLWCGEGFNHGWTIKLLKGIHVQLYFLLFDHTNFWLVTIANYIVNMANLQQTSFNVQSISWLKKLTTIPFILTAYRIKSKAAIS